VAAHGDLHRTGAPPQFQLAIGRAQVDGGEVEQLVGARGGEALAGLGG
jgi:hypothetical protein